jgi:hypothetical protein
MLELETDKTLNRLQVLNNRPTFPVTQVVTVCVSGVALSLFAGVINLSTFNRREIRINCLVQLGDLPT